MEYFCESSQLICTIVGGLANISKWYRNGVIITSEDDLFSQTIVILSKKTATSQVVLSSGSNSNFVGLFGCEITDGNGRTTNSTLQLNGIL